MDHDTAERIVREHERDGGRCPRCHVTACDARLAAEAVLRMLPVVEAACEWRDGEYTALHVFTKVDAYRAALAGGSPEPAAPPGVRGSGRTLPSTARTREWNVSAAPAPAADEIADAAIDFLDAVTAFMLGEVSGAMVAKCEWLDRQQPEVSHHGAGVPSIYTDLETRVAWMSVGRWGNE